jgi:ribose 5-phosphate isomerase B
MIYIAGDHHAEPVLVRIRAFLMGAELQHQEFGYRSGANPAAKLQDFIPQVANAVRREEGATGILVCGTGAGVEIGANRFAGIRASLCGSPQAAKWARVYDDANILCIASWSDPQANIEDMLAAWFGATYDGNPDRRQMFKVFDSWTTAR